MKLFLVLSLAALAACKADSSSTLSTGEIQAYYTSEAHDSASPYTHFVGIFSEDLTTDVTLASGDSITVRTDKGQYALALGDLHVYSTDPASVADTTASFDFVHAGTTVSSTIALPSEALFTSPINPTLTYGDGSPTITVSWSNPIDGAKVYLAPHPCNGASTITLPVESDMGSYTTPLSSLVVGAPTAATCIQINVVRLIDGIVNPAFKSGSTIQSKRYKDYAITLTP